MRDSDSFLSGLAMTRRDLLGAFAVAAMASAVPLSAIAQAG